MIREYLLKLQALQLKAFDKGINMHLGTRQSDGPWLVVHMYMEDVDLTNTPDKEQPFLILSVWDFVSESEMRKKLDEDVALLENFIETHGTYMLGDLPIGATFTIPGSTDELPTEATGSGHHYLYRVSSRKVSDKTRAYITDLKTYVYLDNKTRVNYQPIKTH